MCLKVCMLIFWKLKGACTGGLLKISREFMLLRKLLLKRELELKCMSLKMLAIGYVVIMYFYLVIRTVCSKWWEQLISIINILEEKKKQLEFLFINSMIGVIIYSIAASLKLRTHRTTNDGNVLKLKVLLMFPSHGLASMTYRPTWQW